MVSNCVDKGFLRTASLGFCLVSLLVLASACTSLPNSFRGLTGDDAFTSPIVQARGTRHIVAPSQREGYRPFYADQLHVQVTLPPGWVGSEGSIYLYPDLPDANLGFGPAIVAFNSWGEAGFWAKAVQVGYGGYDYGSKVVLGQLPDDGAYVVVRESSLMGMGHSYVEHESRFLTDLWQARDCRSGESGASGAGSESVSDSMFASPLVTKPNGSDGTSNFRFCKWAQCYVLEVYCASEVSDDTAEAVTSLLKSWEFDAYPTGDERWARQQAVRVLPTPVRELFSPLGLGGSDWMIPGETLKKWFTETQSDGDTIAVEFNYRWNDPTFDTGSLECPEDRCHWWRVEVGPEGETTLISEGGAVLP